MSQLTHLPFGLPGQIYRSPMPFASFDFDRSLLQAYLDAGIDTVVMLTAEGEDQHRAGQDLHALYTQNNLQVLHLPVTDFGIPQDMQALDEALVEAITQAQQGRNLVVHCYAGQGRTGMFIALLARRILGLDGPGAITWAREYFPAVETDEQALVVIQDKAE